MLPLNPLLHATAPAGPHLPVALLRQYAAGTLAPATQHRVEAHTLACPRCADLLEGLLQTTPAATDQALAKLQQQLRQRVAQQAAPARQVHALRHPRLLVLQLAAAATLLLGLVAGGWWVWQQRRAARAAPAAMAVIPTPTTPLSPAPAAQATSTARAAAPLVAAIPASPRHTTAARATLSQQRRTLAHQHARLAARPAAPSMTAGPAPVPPPQSPPLATSSTPAAKSIATLPPVDSAASALKTPVPPVTSFAADPALVRATAMPAAPGLAPAPVGGIAALREQLRREAAEFVPESPDQPLSGTVQLRVTIGADGKIQQIITLRGLRADYDAEAQRLVCQGPAWVPGVSGGRRAAQTIDIAVPF
jgi:hypothetical protein